MRGDEVATHGILPATGDLLGIDQRLASSLSLQTDVGLKAAGQVVSMREIATEVEEIVLRAEAPCCELTLLSAHA